MAIRNRELSQFGSFVYVENSTQEIGITTETFPYVGIGTTNPQSKLHVIGDSIIEGGATVGGSVSATSYYLNGDLLVNPEIQAWNVSGSNIYRINGNVGIGKSILSEKLDILGNVKANQFISTVTTGTSPFVVNSQTLVTNLNSDYLRGKTPPSGDIVGTTDSQTLSNKTLTSPIISTIVNGGTLTLPTTTGTLVSTGSTGVVTSNMIADLSITNTDVAVSAGIVYSKLNLSNSITNTDIAVGAGIVYSKLNLSNSITNADIATGAAIANSKLANSTISGVSLGSNLNSLTAGSFITYDSGSIYNGTAVRTISVNATSSNTASSIVSRDSLGGFNAGSLSVTSTGMNVTGNTNISGITTLGITTATNLTSQRLNVSGITTVGLGTTSNPTNSQMSFDLTSNTNLRLSVRGTDSVLRNVNITLSADGILSAGSGADELGLFW